MAIKSIQNNRYLTVKDNISCNDIVIPSLISLAINTIVISNKKSNDKTTKKLENLKINKKIYKKLKENPHNLWNLEYFTFLYRNLRECHCFNINVKIREFLEDFSIQEIEKKFKKKEELTIVSFGCGKCLQELIYLSKLIDKGFKKIHIQLIDNDKKVLQSVKDLKKFKKEFFKDSNIKITYYSMLEKYEKSAKKNPNLKPDFLMLIDIDGNPIKKLLHFSYDFFVDKKLFTSKTIVAYSKKKHPYYSKKKPSHHILDESKDFNKFYSEDGECSEILGIILSPYNELLCNSKKHLKDTYF